MASNLADSLPQPSIVDRRSKADSKAETVNGPKEATLGMTIHKGLVYGKSKSETTEMEVPRTLLLGRMGPLEGLDVRSKLFKIHLLLIRIAVE